MDKLRKRISILWTDVPLGEALANLAATQSIPVFLDRRVDPNQKLVLDVRQEATGEVLYQVADLTGCAVCWLGDVAYFGPVEEVAKMIVLRDELIRVVQRLPNVAKRKYLDESRSQWPRLSQPSKLLDKQLSALGVENSTVQLPHDLWAGFRAPSIRAFDRLILIVFGFGRWPSLSVDASLQLETVPLITEGTVQIRVSSTTRREQMGRLKKEFPGVTIRANRQYLVVQGDPVSLYRIRRAIAKIEFGSTDGNRPGNGGKRVVSGRVKGTIGQALTTAAHNLSVELKYDPVLRSLFLKQIDLTANRITNEELIEMVLVGTGLEYVLDDKTLLIRKKAPE